MFGRLARTMYRRRRWVVGVWVFVFIASAAMASQVSKVLGPGEFTIPGSDAAKASAILDHKFNQNDQKVTLVALQNSRLLVSDLAYQKSVSTVVARIRADRTLHAKYLDNPLVSGNTQFISKDHHAVILTVSSTLAETDLEQQIDHLRTLTHLPGFKTYVLGTAAANHDYAITQQKDLARGDSITIPIMIAVLLLVFGAVVAALVPLMLAGCAIAVSLALVFVFAHFMSASIYVTNVVVFLGLGVAIDYTLFIVYRFRDELVAAGGDREQAVVRTMETTGRAVFFSGLTVAIALASLIMTQVPFMASMGLGGMLVPLAALLVAMTLLPAVLGFLGPNVNRWRVLPRRFLASSNGGVWRRVANAVMARPLVSGGLVLAVLLGLAYPLTQLNFAFGSLKNAPQNIESVAGYEFMKAHFTTTSDPTQITLQAHGTGSLRALDQLAGMRAFERQLRHDPEVSAVNGPADFISPTGQSTAQQRSQLGRYLTPDNRTAIISVVPRHEVGTKQNSDMVRRIRTVTQQFGQGALHGDTLYVGGVAEWVPLFLFAFLFGLSMDYEVFLLSRMREHWLATGKNRESVAYGLEKTGRLISSAAAIMVIAFAGLLAGHEVQMKEFGFGLIASIALDATLIRLILVPSIMELMGNANWWLPGFLQRFAQTYDPFGDGAPAAIETEEEELESMTA